MIDKLFYCSNTEKISHYLAKLQLQQLYENCITTLSWTRCYSCTVLFTIETWLSSLIQSKCFLTPDSVFSELCLLYREPDVTHLPMKLFPIKCLKNSLVTEVFIISTMFILLGMGVYLQEVYKSFLFFACTCKLGCLGLCQALGNWYKHSRENYHCSLNPYCFQVTN